MTRGQNKRGLTFNEWLAEAKEVPRGFASWSDARPYWRDGATLEAALLVFRGERKDAMEALQLSLNLSHDWNGHMDRVQPIIRAQGNRGTV